MDIYAIIDADGNVLNVCLWDGDTSNWQPPEGTQVVLVPKGEPAEPGGTYDGSSFTSSVKAPVTPSLQDQIQTLQDTVNAITSLPDVQTALSEAGISSLLPNVRDA